MFSVLFAGFMAFIGCKMLFNTTDQANIASINRKLEKDIALSQFDKGLEFYDQKKYV